MTDDTSLQDQIDDATFDFTMGDSKAALSKLTALSAAHPNSFETWHALTEVYFSEGRYDDALSAGDQAHTLNPNDIHINTSLSRIWVERGRRRPGTYAKPQRHSHQHQPFSYLGRARR